MGLPFTVKTVCHPLLPQSPTQIDRYCRFRKPGFLTFFATGRKRTSCVTQPLPREAPLVAASDLVIATFSTAGSCFTFSPLFRNTKFALRPPTTHSLLPEDAGNDNSGACTDVDLLVDTAFGSPRCTTVKRVNAISRVARPPA
jgi:hypothetical protein